MCGCARCSTCPGSRMTPATRSQGPEEQEMQDWPMWLCILIFLALLLGIYQKRKKDEDY